MADWVIERLHSHHLRSEFTSGKEPLDRFLRTLVTQYEKRRLGRTFVATQPGNHRVAGYYTLAAGSIAVDCLPPAQQKKLPKHPIPTVHLGRLAVDSAFRGKRLGETLLMHALSSTLKTSENVGAFAIDVWAIDDEAKAFYQKYGFIALEDDVFHLYLPMKTVETMFRG
jgi:ribosomal protein S18 acetylase RimI-like enzyme